MEPRLCLQKTDCQNTGAFPCPLSCWRWLSHMDGAEASSVRSLQKSKSVFLYSSVLLFPVNKMEVVHCPRENVRRTGKPITEWRNTEAFIIDS